MSIENIFHIWRQRNFTLHFPFVDLKFAKLYIYGCFLVTKLCPTLLQPHGQEPNRLPSPWDFPGKNTGVGCHFLFLGIFPTRDGTYGSCIAGRFFTTEPSGYGWFITVICKYMGLDEWANHYHHHHHLTSSPGYVNSLHSCHSEYNLLNGISICQIVVIYQNRHFLEFRLSNYELCGPTIRCIWTRM